MKVTFKNDSLTAVSLTDTSGKQYVVGAMGSTATLEPSKDSLAFIENMANLGAGSFVEAKESPTETPEAEEEEQPRRRKQRRKKE